MKILAPLLLFFPVITNGQNISILFKSASKDVAVPFVTVYTKGKVKAADANGVIILTGNNAGFSTSHVSFADTAVAIKNIKNDTSIIVYLQEHIEVLNSFTVPSPENYLTKKYLTSGNAHRRSDYVISLHSNLKVGIFYEQGADKASGKYLRSIQLRLQNANALNAQKFPLELKIFRINGGLIDSVPANKKQIIVFSDKLKAVSEIFVQQRIKIPPEGLFFSLELPPVFPGADTNANLYAGFTSDNCRLFISGNYGPYWDPTLLQKPCTRDDQGKARDIVYSITYFDSK